MYFYSQVSLTTLIVKMFSSDQFSFVIHPWQNDHYGIDTHHILNHTHHILNHTHSIFPHCFDEINGVKAAMCLTAVIHGVQRYKRPRPPDTRTTTHRVGYVRVHQSSEMSFSLLLNI